MLTGQTASTPTSSYVLYSFEFLNSKQDMLTCIIVPYMQIVQFPEAFRKRGQKHVDAAALERLPFGISEKAWLAFTFIT